jgi:hypothetical protein
MGREAMSFLHATGSCTSQHRGYCLVAGTIDLFYTYKVSHAEMLQQSLEKGCSSARKWLCCVLRHRHHGAKAGAE